MIVLLKLHQQEAFIKLHDLQREKEIDSRSKILTFSPIVDRDYFAWPVAKRAINLRTKTLILLSSHDTLTDLIIRDQHSNNFHIGP